MQTFERVKLLIGEQGYQKLKKAHVAVFGVGGVGGYVVEALVRSGIGEITIFDNDIVSESNINRQIIATVDNVGKSKVDVVKTRLLDINPKIKVNVNQVFYLPENADNYPFNGYDYVIDAVDTVSAKLEIILRAVKENIKIISCMGTGGKLSPLSLKIADIKQTKNCPLARVMRRELKKRNINDLKVIYSEEQPSGDFGERKSPPSMIFVPATAGLVIASEVVKDLISR